MACVVALGMSASTLAEAGRTIAQATAPETAKPSKEEARTVTLHGTVEAVDKDKGTVTIKGSKGRTVTVAVRDPKKLDVVKVGDPVVAKYYESLAIQVKKAGQPPGRQRPGGGRHFEARRDARRRRRPPGDADGDRSQPSTPRVRPSLSRGPKGNEETIKVRNPKNLTGVKVGDLVEVTYTQALAIALDTPAAKK